MKFSKLKILLLILFGLIILSLTSCVGTRTLMMTAPNKPSSRTVRPELPSITIEKWETEKPDIWNTLQTEIYGILPQNKITEMISSRKINSEHLNADITETTLRSSYMTDKGSGLSREQPIEFKISQHLPFRR